jgi:four helix bundle protein
MATFRHFTDIQAWREARAFNRSLYGLMNGIHAPRDVTLKNQLSRASLSIMNNIAEGFARGTDAQFAQFLTIARGSAAEVESMLYVIEDVASALQSELSTLKLQLDLIISLIAKLTTYLRKSQARESEDMYSVQETSGLPDFRTSGH